MFRKRFFVRVKEEDGLSNSRKKADRCNYFFKKLVKTSDDTKKLFWGVFILAWNRWTLQIPRGVARSEEQNLI